MAYLTQMANRANQQSPGAGAGPGSPSHPGLLRSFQSAPAGQGGIGRGGLAAKRNRPNFNIHDIIGSDGGGGASGAGLGAGVPDSRELPRRPPAMAGSPFSNFDKIVYVFTLLKFLSALRLCVCFL